MNKTVSLPDLNLSVVDSSYAEVLDHIREQLPELHGKFAVFFEGNLLACVLRDGDVRELLKEADWIFPDGVAVSKLASWQAGRPVERISGPTFLLKACEYGQAYHWKHFFYGGTPESLAKLTDKLKSAYPAMDIVGSYAPPFRPLTDEEETQVAETIDACRPDFLWVGLGGPKQEYWIRAHREKLNAAIMLGVGAAFDFHSGARPWAPPVVRKLGLEWLWRALSGGRKTFFRNLRCVSAVAWYLFTVRVKRMFSRRQG